MTLRMGFRVFAEMARVSLADRCVMQPWIRDHNPPRRAGNQENSLRNFPGVFDVNLVKSLHLKRG
jgi:hypothetical protein